MTFWKWSRTASLNASADATINWAEGQPPSSVNDSARAMMAAAAKYRDDISGAIATGGTSTAYTVATYQAFDSRTHMSGAMIAFTAHVTNDATVTLNVDSTGARPLRSSPGVELPSGALILGTPYVATYNFSDDVFYLQGGLANPYNIPLGGVLPYIGSSTPNSAFAFPIGQAISRTTYATLFSLISTTFGSGDGSTTFNLPDLRGRFVAGLDNMGGGASASRLSAALTSTGLGNTGGAQNQAIAQAHLPNVNFPVTANHRHTAEASDQGYAVVFALGVGTTTTTNVQPAAGLITYVTGVGQTFQNLSTTFTSLSTGGDTANSGGSGAPLITVPPTIVTNFILRIV